MTEEPVLNSRQVKDFSPNIDTEIEPHPSSYPTATGGASSESKTAKVWG